MPRIEANRGARIGIGASVVKEVFLETPSPNLHVDPGLHSLAMKTPCQRVEPLLFQVNS